MGNERCLNNKVFIAMKTQEKDHSDIFFVPWAKNGFLGSRLGLGPRPLTSTYIEEYRTNFSNLLGVLKVIYVQHSYF